MSQQRDQDACIAITDLWFVSGDSLDGIASHLGLVDVERDAENYWEWVIGALPELGGIRLDLTRTHTVPAAETDTRIFVCGDDDEAAMSDALVALISARLRATGIAPIHAGRWVHRRGEDFDRVVARIV